MEYIFLLGKLILFFVSNLGLWEFFRRKSKMNIYFLPAFTICFQIMVLFCAGILNFLKTASVCMYAVSIFFGVYYLCNDFKEIIRIYLNWGYAFFAVAFCVVLFACKGQVFTGYDNFSHWALVVKNMLLTDRYPSFQDSLIVFQGYPLGSSSYVYYFAKMVSASEFAQMAAQALMSLSFILPVFRYVKKNFIASSVLILLFANCIFCYNIKLTSLLVDTLLPLQGMAALFFIYSECLDFSDKEYTPGGMYLICHSISLYVYSN